MGKNKRLSRVIVGASLAVFIVLSQACTTVPMRTSPALYRPLSGIPHAVAIGSIQATFRIMAETTAEINLASRQALLRDARVQHGQGVDIADITWIQTQHRQVATGRHSALPAQFFAIGIIIVTDPNEVPTGIPVPGIENALERAVENIAGSLPNGTRVAVLYMLAQDAVSTEFLTGELALLLLKQNFVVVDLELDRIRAAYRLGVDFEAIAYVLRRLGLEQIDPGLDIMREGPGIIGTVDNATAARIGQFAGASVILIGGIDGGTGDFRRLRLRAVDTATAQVLGAASERIF